MADPFTAPAGFRGRFLVAAEDRDPYGHASGILQQLPAAIAVPEDADDLASLVRWAANSGVSLVPRGAGTGMPGGNVGPGVAIDLVSRLKSVSVAAGPPPTASLQPGVTLAELNAAASPLGLHFPVDPSSGERCSLGGMLANNSAGSHSVKYGATRSWVRSAEVILDDGSQATLARGAAPEGDRLCAIKAEVDSALAPQRSMIEAAWPRVRKNSSGYALREYLESGDLLDLVIGSEGTLALIVGADVDLAPIAPARGVALVEFSSLDAAGEAVLAILPTNPATCEMLDRTFLDLVREGGFTGFPLDPGLEAILIVEMEGLDAEEVSRALERVTSAAAPFARRTSVATSPIEQKRFWDIRHAASPIIAARAGARRSMQFIEDSVVPIERLPDYVRALRSLLDRHHLPAVIFGHAGDGNLHVNPLVDTTRPGWEEMIEDVLREVAGTVARLGGTLAGEHGDGRLRAPFLETIWGTEIVGLFERVKNAFDPAGIFNPGVILPLPGQRPFDSLRRYPTH